MDMEWLVGVVGVFMLFGGGSIARTWIQGKLEIDRIKAMNAGNTGNASNAEVLNAIAELRKEVGELRDTTTKFDLSFDSAIVRLEQRMDLVERLTQDDTSEYKLPTKPIEPHAHTYTESKIEIEPLPLRRG